MDSLLSELRWLYPRNDPADLVPTAVRGYWEHKTSCGGRGACAAPIHQFLFNEGPMPHTISFFDHARDRESGRWLSPYRTWRRHRLAYEAKPEHYDLVALEQP